ncbi:MAG: hypothetical protein FD135_1114 [Comamonadaceae bacterium]|nr:MAG: hypothetical protein FD135_1114 [Comamonadaceae bacterium]
MVARSAFGATAGHAVMEVKPGRTFAAHWPDTILKWQKLAPDATLAPVIVFDGEGDYVSQACRGGRSYKGLVCR